MTHPQHKPSVNNNFGHLVMCQLFELQDRKYLHRTCYAVGLKMEVDRVTHLQYLMKSKLECRVAIL